MTMGRSIHDIGTPRLSWVEVRAYLRWAPPGSAISRLDDPLDGFNTPESVLLSAVADALYGANWQRGGGRGARPAPIRTLLRQAYDKQRAAMNAPSTTEQITSIRDRLEARRRELAQK